MAEALRIVIGEDDVLLREGIARLLGMRASQWPKRYAS
jgi:hypothetical protein